MNLYHSNHNNMKIFRIMSLYLENRTNPTISDIIKEYLPKIPTSKYIIMLPQLIPHISDTNCDNFSTDILKIIEKCATDHPHHTLPLLLSLANANKDREFDKDDVTNTSQNDGRINAAVALINKLKKQAKLTRIIERLQKLCEALIELAYYAFTATKDQKKITIPDNHKILQIENYDDVAVPTDHLSIRMNNSYTNVVGKCQIVI